MKKTSVQSNINLETLAGGAFAEKLNEALMQVAENIQNPNTEATTKRQIQITLKFAPNKTRQLVSTQIAVTTKLAATEAIDTQMIMGVNMRTGQNTLACLLSATVRRFLRSTPCCLVLNMAENTIRRAFSFLCSHASRKATTAKLSPCWQAIS